MLDEVAPPSAKHKRMVKHIKKSYSKKGGLSKDEESIAYATAWKHYKKKMNEGYKEGSVKDELLSKANKAHRKAKKFKEWRNAANKASLKKGEVKRLVNGKWVSNKK